MFGEEKNLKDSSSNLGITIKDSLLSVSYTKTNKLITALYMVTDIIDKDEPLRNKLRTLGTGIVSDINSTPANACSKASEIISFLDIASAVNIISEMNCNILKKEFLELNQSIKEAVNKTKTINRQINLSEFFGPSVSNGHLSSSGGRENSKGHTNIGVQKGSTLMKALSGVKVSDRKLSHVNVESFDILKKQRRGEIINLIQKRGGSATITDIKNGASGLLTSCSEKTLQRELISMVKEDVLNKMGEKRWSRYFIK